MRVPLLVLAALLSLQPASAQDIPYLGPRGLPASAFSAPQRAVADIVSPTRSTDKQRDAIDESGQLILSGLHRVVHVQC